MKNLIVPAFLIALVVCVAIAARQVKRAALESTRSTAPTPASEFVRITDRKGSVYMFRPHMVSELFSEATGVWWWLLALGTSI